MIKTLAGSIRQYKKQTIMSPVTVALEVFFEIMIPLIMVCQVSENPAIGSCNLMNLTHIDITIGFSADHRRCTKNQQT